MRFLRWIHYRILLLLYTFVYYISGTPKREFRIVRRILRRGINAFGFWTGAVPGILSGLVSVKKETFFFFPPRYESQVADNVCCDDVLRAAAHVSSAVLGDIITRISREGEDRNTTRRHARSDVTRFRRRENYCPRAHALIMYYVNYHVIGVRS